MSKKTVSFSQLSEYFTCKHKWKLLYIDKIQVKSESIHLLFGSAMHFVLQEYLTVMYNDTIQKADSLDLNKMLIMKMKDEFKKIHQKTGVYPCTKEQLIEFANDGIEILTWFKKHKSEYFSKKGFELIGCEVPLIVPLKENINFIGYIDLIIKNTDENKIYIYDFKTSTNGWKDYQKNDENKTQQLVLYKKFFSEQFNISPDLINVEFIILKRKLYDNINYVQKRVQLFAPASGKIKMKEVTNKLNNFLNENYDNEDNLILNRSFEKNISRKNCMFCPFNGTEHCDAPIIEK